MMPFSRKLDARIVLADDELFMREIISNTLSTKGYRDVNCVSNLKLVADIVSTSHPDLLILNGEMEQGRAIDLVRQIRHFQLGRNPFVPVIFTAWHPSGDFMGKVVNSGADVLITKPLAADQLFARIDRLINARPPFVATATYIGPDRRHRERDNGFPKFDVPNTLRESVKGRAPDLPDLDTRIAESAARLKHQRRSMQDQDIGKHFAVFMELVRDGKSPDDIAFVLKSMTALVQTCAEDTATAKSTDAAAPAQVLLELLERIASSAPLVSDADIAEAGDLLAELGIRIPTVKDRPPQQRDDVGNHQLAMAH